MSLNAMYDSVAGHYEIANQFGSVSDSHACAIKQINQFTRFKHTPARVLDLGVGDAAFLKELYKDMPLAIFTGIDVSTEMLKIAKQQIPLTTIEASAAKASNFLPHHSQDLVLSHFINAYIPIHTLFNQVHHLTRPNACFSFITTTYDAFPKAQKQLADFISKGSVISRIVGHYYKAVVRNTTVAASQAELIQTFSQHKFDIIDHKRLQIPVTFNSIEELAIFGIEGTWFLNSLSIRMLPKQFLLQRIKRLFSKIFTFPYHDTHIIDVILAKNKV